MKPDNTGDSKTKDIRIFMDGAFDLMHYGHMNAFRLGRSLGTYLIVGVNSDSSITMCKGAPLMNDQERLTMVKSCKFVDEVITDCPYIMDADYVNWVIETYKIDYVVHGDDPCIVDGKDVYAAAKAAGKFRNIPRTHGISTTDITGRMLMLAQNPHFRNLDVDGNDVTAEHVTLSLPTSTLLCHRSVFLTTSRVIHLFQDHRTLHHDKSTQKSRTVYIDGSWDMFNPGHIAILEAAKKVWFMFQTTDENNFTLDWLIFTFFFCLAGRVSNSWCIQ
jgi:ethanolamine-phosphate cytidylyltransferase